MKRPPPRQVLLRRQPFATLVPLSPDFAFARHAANTVYRYVASRFCYCRREGANWILESPLAAARVVLHSAEAFACLSELAQPAEAADLARRVPGVTAAAARGFLELLENAGAVTRVNPDGSTREDRTNTLRSWEFHDLLFHAASRVGRHDRPYGKRPLPPGAERPPCLKRLSPTRVLPLDRSEGLADPADISLLRALKERKSIRDYAKTPLTLHQLGLFLYHAAAVTKFYNIRNIPFTRRPYPTAGASYELEIYLVVNRCRGLAPGLYHYDPAAHSLGCLSGRTSSSDRLLKSAAAAARAAQPQVLLLLSARFQRISLDYASIAYACILKDVGCLMQTFYLVATGLGLAPCAIGTGNPDVFAKAAGLDYYEETSVAEFLLGSRKERPRRRGGAEFGLE